MKYHITVCLVAERPSDADDLANNPAGTYAIEAADKDQALDEFHAAVPIGCLEDFRVYVHPVHYIMFTAPEDMNGQDVIAAVENAISEYAGDCKECLKTCDKSEEAGWAARMRIYENIGVIEEEPDDLDKCLFDPWIMLASHLLNRRCGDVTPEERRTAKQAFLSTQQMLGGIEPTEVPGVHKPVIPMDIEQHCTGTVKREVKHDGCYRHAWYVKKDRSMWLGSVPIDGMGNPQDDFAGIREHFSRTALADFAQDIIDDVNKVSCGKTTSKGLSFLVQILETPEEPE